MALGIPDSAEDILQNDIGFEQFTGELNNKDFQESNRSGGKPYYEIGSSFDFESPTSSINVTLRADGYMVTINAKPFDETKRRSFTGANALKTALENL